VSADEITCRLFVELITDYFEGALADRTHVQMEEHLVICNMCSTYLEQMQTTIGLLGDLKEEASPELEPSPEPPAVLLDALRTRRKRTH